jgi:hypothetical protein
MPRKARLDAPGALHHIVVRGIDRRKIFRDDCDRDDFLERLSAILCDCRTACFAWALKTGQTPIAIRMRLYREFVQKEAGRGRRRELRYRVILELGHTARELARRMNRAEPTGRKSVDRRGQIAAEKRVTLLPK